MLALLDALLTQSVPVEYLAYLTALAVFGITTVWRDSLPFDNLRLRYGIVAVVWLLVVGLLCGTLAATTALLPSLWSRPDQPPWMSLLFTLTLVLMVGMAACVAAVTASLRAPLLPSLKDE